MGKKGKKNKSKDRKPSEVFKGFGTNQEVPRGGTALDKENGAAKGKGKYTVDQILEKVEENIDTYNFQMAKRFCDRALEIDPGNIKVLETAGNVQLELGNIDEAKSYFNKAISIEPECGHSKYMYLGQLLTGVEAIECFNKGIALMEKHLKEQKNVAAGDQEACTNAKDLSCAYCAVAEIYLTDACMEEEAEARCKENLDKAISVDISNPEGFHLMASFWLSKDDKQQAREMVEKGVNLWLPQLRDAVKPEGAQLEDPVEICPLNYPARMNAAKILIEVESYEIASDILELLLDEEDQVVEVWYMLGWLNHLQGGDYYGNARYYLKKAKEVIGKTGFDDHAVIAHIESLLVELGPGDVEEEEGDEGEFNETESEDEEMQIDGGQGEEMET